MLLQARRPGRRRRKRILVLTLAVAVVALWWAYEPLRRRYEFHRASQAVDRARNFVQQGDLRNALLAVQVARGTEAFDLTALRLMADILELQNQGDALAIRQEILRLVSDSASDRTACVRTALRFGQMQVAQDTFAGFSSEQRATDEVLRCEAMLRVAQNRPREAEAALNVLSRHNESDAAIRFELAALKLRGGKDAGQEESRAYLRQLAAQQSPTTTPALRELVRDAATRGDATEARALAERLVRQPDSTFDDVIRQLNIERTWPGLSSGRLILTARGQAGREPATATQWINWMTLTGNAKAALDWSDALPAAIRTSSAVRGAVAGAYATTHDWASFARELEKGAWPGLHADTLHAAMNARIRREQNDVEGARKAWRDAIDLNRQRRSDLLALFRLASLWQYEEQQAATLRALAENYPSDTWPLQQLAVFAYRRADTAALRETFALWSQLHPADQRARNDWVTASLLTTAGKPGAALAAEAERVYRSDPSNPGFTTTWAHLRWRQGDLAGALTLLAGLSPAERDHPARSLYYGAMLAAAGRSEEAALALSRVVETKLLPEERALLARARALLAPKDQVALKR